MPIQKPSKLLIAILVGLFMLGVSMSAADFLQKITGESGADNDFIAGDTGFGFNTANKLRANITTMNAAFKTGTGSPEAAVTAGVSSIYFRTDGADGTALAYKGSGSGNTGWVFPATAASTNTFTNKTLDVEGTGNVLTVTEKRLFPGAICQNATAISEWSTPTSNPATFTCVTGTNTQKGALTFTDDGSTVLSAQTQTWLPSDFSGTVDARIRWYTSATSGNVIWSLATICVADAETSDPAYNTASTVTDAAKGTTLQDNDAAITSVTITGCAAGELLYLKLSRDPGGSDTLGATANVRAVELTIRRAL